MGNGVLRSAPPYDEFRHFSEEYDKLKNAGLSTEEMHGILVHRLQKMVSKPSSSSSSSQNHTVVHIPSKEDDVRHGESTSDSKGSGKPAAKPAPEPVVPKGPLGTVLLIDDSPVAAKVASKVLVNLNFDVVVANSAKMGFDILTARKDDIDLIFLDVVMPTVDGVECLGWIKDNADVAHIPVYMLSGLEDQMLTDVCLDRGAEGMLLKPLNKDMVKNIMLNHNLGGKHQDSPSNQQRNEASGESRMKEKPSMANNLSVVIPKTQDDTESKADVPEAVRQQQSHQQKQVKLTTNTLIIGNQAPAFKLVDSDMNEFVFPNPNSRKNLLLLFIPTIFCTYFFEEAGFLMRFFSYYDALVQANTLQIACVSADLPQSLHAAKRRFKIPFNLLSDPSLFVSQRYVGSMDIGKSMVKYDAMNGEGELANADHNQNQFVGPALGMILLNRKREVMNKWVAASSLFDNVRNLQQGQFPDHFDEWLTMATDLGATSPRAKTNSAIEPHHNAAEESKNSPRTTKSIVHNTSTEPASEPAKPKAAAAQSESNGKLNVLVVDDSSVSSRVASKKLEMLGYNVSMAYNGQQGFELLKKKPAGYFSVILSDVVMPVCDGLGLLKLIKNDSDLKNIPILMLSGLEGEELSKNCLDLGANALLKKPFDERKFHEIVKTFNLPN